MAKRGQLTKGVQQAATRLLSREITQLELRLMPYIQNLMVDGKSVDRRKINDEERHILEEWRSRGYIQDPWDDRIKCGRYFWDVMSELIWLAYADNENQPE